VQGMNFMVGFIQMMSGGKEKETFWFFNSLLEKSSEPIPFDGLKEFYPTGFPLLIQYVEVFRELFREQLPKLYDHFEQEEMKDPLWIQKWFMTCFLYSFPFSLCIRIWDNLLASGSRFLFNTALAILKILEEMLLQLDMCGICELFQSLKNDEHLDYKFLPSVEEIIEEAQSIYIEDQRMKELFDKHKVEPIKVVPKRERRETITTNPKISIPSKYLI
jgi:hypothetical protein